MELGEPWFLDALAGAQGVMAFLSFMILRRLGSPYGRYSSPLVRWWVPARLAWVLQELPSLAVPLLECARAAPGQLGCPPNACLLVMFLVHYAYRAQLMCPCESSCSWVTFCMLKDRSLIFPFLIRGGKPMPLYTCALAFTFCVCNGYLQGRYLSQYAEYAEDWVTDPRFLAGFALWLVGILINIHSDHILRNLRKPGETGYKIPRGGLFEYVTAANYFGEIVEWCGYALASWSAQGGAFALFTFCILSSRAEQHHRWYLEKFEDYPKSRKILFPFLF